MKSIVAFGNPLLDTIVFVTNNNIFDKYNLKRDGQKEVSKEIMNKLKQDIQKESKTETYIAGGCAQNSLRVLQWLTKKEHNAIIFGSVGNDDDAQLLKKLLEEDGVSTNYIVQKNFTTGKTISLVNGANRSLVAHLGAAEVLSCSDLLNNLLFEHSIEKADYLYIEGYFLTKREEAATYILDRCNVLNKIIVFNICGEYVSNLVPNTLNYFVDNSDIVIGNSNEFETLAKIRKLNSVETLVEMLLKKGKNKLEKYGNIVVITNGEKPIICYYNNGKKYLYEVQKISTNEIKDTTGAGDAFVGGFLAGLFEEKSIEECIKIGSNASIEIIKQTGCTLPL